MSPCRDPHLFPRNLVHLRLRRLSVMCITAVYTHSFTQYFLDPTNSVPPTGSTSPPNSPDRVIPSHHIHKNLVGVILGVIAGSIALFSPCLFARTAIAFTRISHNTLCNSQPRYPN